MDSFLLKYIEVRHERVQRLDDSLVRRTIERIGLRAAWVRTMRKVVLDVAATQR